MNCFRGFIALVIIGLTCASQAAPLTLATAPDAGDLLLASKGRNCRIIIEAGEDHAVALAAMNLKQDFVRVAGNPSWFHNPFSRKPNPIIIGTLGRSPIIDRLAAEGKLATNGISGQWESYVLQVVTNPMPGVKTALVIAGSDRRGTIYGIYQLSELIGVSPWYWWADVPVPQRKLVALRGDLLRQGPPAVKYRGIFLNDEDWGLRPWAAKTLEPENGNIGPKTYAKIFELLLRLHANYLWPAMHPGTAAFNSFPIDRELADEYGIVMGSSHCEQMLRNNVSEWDEKTFGEYDYVKNRDGVLKYWEQRVRENGQFENVYTVGMRGIHDGAMPGGGTPPEKAQRLLHIIQDQRDMLSRLVSTNVAAIPQIFCPYKEVLELYHLAPNIPDDITLVWPDDNYGYIREFSDARERARNGGAGVYYHVSYWGRPRDYLWLCSTPPALIAEEMSKAYDYGADKVWLLNVGDLKPAELDIEFFLKLAWNPRAWTGTNTYDLLGQQLARDFGATNAEPLVSILSEYYRLNFQRKPEHMDYPTNNLFTSQEAAQRLDAWHKIVAQVDDLGKKLPSESQAAFFELIAYPVKAAAAMNDKCLAGSQAAADQIRQLTDAYNNQIAGGKWRHIMSANPRGQVDFGVPKIFPVKTNTSTADSGHGDHCIVLPAAHASAFIPGRDAHWQIISGLGYQGEAVSVFPTIIATRSTPEQILAESPCLQFKVALQEAGDWHVTVRALPTFSVEPNQPQRYAIALDDAPPQIIALPVSTSETDRHWSENVLRNAALTSSVQSVTQSGQHTLKIWMVDPGIVLDAIALQNGDGGSLGYVWPVETN